MANLYQFKPMLGPAEDFPAGSIEWAERMSNRLQIGSQSVTRSTAQHLRKHLKAIWDADPRPWDIWPKEQPFGTPDNYCRVVTGHTWASLLCIVSELTGDLDLTPERMMAENARAQVETKPQGKKHDVSSLSYNDDGDDDGALRQGTGSAYLLRRLARDHEDILSRYEAGEFQSVRAAAREAGIVKDVKPFDQIKKLLPKLTPTEKRKLKELLK